MKSSGIIWNDSLLDRYTLLNPLPIAHLTGGHQLRDANLETMGQTKYVPEVRFQTHVETEYDNCSSHLTEISPR